MKKITDATLVIRYQYFKIRLINLLRLTEIIEALILSKMDSHWNHFFVPKIENSDNPSKTEEAFNLLFDSEIDDMNLVFEYTIWSSIFSTAYYFFENELTNTTKLLAKEYDKEAELKAMKDSGITLCQEFIKSHLDFEFPDQSKEWGELKNYNRIRNCIAHSGGYTNSKKIERYIDRKDSLGRHDSGQIKLTKNFITECIEMIDNFLTKLAENLSLSESI